MLNGTCSCDCSCGNNTNPSPYDPGPQPPSKNWNTTGNNNGPTVFKNDIWKRPYNGFFFNNDIFGNPRSNGANAGLNGFDYINMLLGLSQGRALLSSNYASSFSDWASQFNKELAAYLASLDSKTSPFGPLCGDDSDLTRAYDYLYAQLQANLTNGINGTTVDLLAVEECDNQCLKQRDASEVKQIEDMIKNGTALVGGKPDEAAKVAYRQDHDPDNCSIIPNSCKPDGNTPNGMIPKDDSCAQACELEYLILHNLPAAEALGYDPNDTTGQSFKTAERKLLIDSLKGNTGYQANESHEGTPISSVGGDLAAAGYNVTNQISMVINNQSISDLAGAINNNEGVIALVNWGRLDDQADIDGPDGNRGGHYVLVTGVATDKATGNVLGVYINDTDVATDPNEATLPSGASSTGCLGGRLVPVDLFQRAWTGGMSTISGSPSDQPGKLTYTEDGKQVYP